MRIAIVMAVAAFGIGLADRPAHAADPYRWCAVYGGGGEGGATNCYFVTIEQCRAAVSGMGGFCYHNPFYTGPAADGPRRTRKLKPHD